MSTLKVKFHGNNLNDLLLESGHEYFGGRGENCQIKMDFDKTFSRHHIKIFQENQIWFVEFIAKYGALYVGDQQLVRLELKNNTFFSVPPYEFEFVEVSANLINIVKNQHDLNNTDIIENASGNNPYLPKVKTNTNLSFNEDEQNPNTNTNVSERTVTVIQASHKTGYMVLYNEKDSPKKSYQVTEQIFYVGRDEDNNIVLNHARVSRRQFKITKVVDKYFLQDLGSINGTLLNGNKVSSSDPVQLISGDIITVLDFKLSFELRDLEFKNKFRQLQELVPIAPQENFLAQITPASLPMNYQSQSLAAVPYEPPQSEVELEGDEVDSLNFFGLKIALTGKNKFRLGLGLLAFFVIIYGLKGNKPSDQTDPKTDEKPTDPFLKLSPEDQNYIKHTYSLAKNLFMKGEYSLAQSEILKLHEKLPKYEDSQDLEKYINLAIEAQKQSELHEKIEREKRETEEKIQNIVKHCSQLITNSTTTEELNECLGPALELNPEHPDLMTLKMQVSKYAEERELKAKEKEVYDAEVKQLRGQFMEAMKLAELDPLKGVPALEELLNSTLPDPDKLKEKARRQISFINNDVKSKITRAIDKSKSLADTGNLREAVVNLEIAYRLDPENDQIKSEIEHYTNELRKKMQLIYQEAIVDENIGNVESAKEKWKKILDQDVSNGEYYQKSKIKLKKYGLL
jgi:pSer/pThr/pTyr-binding forkhead associated (FHA) protein/tetratricopeptide (TPR) repeat protein